MENEKKKKGGKNMKYLVLHIPHYIYVSFIYIYICLSTEYCIFILHRETTPILFVVKRNLN